MGKTGQLMTNDRISIHKYMTFDTSKAPFDRTSSNGNDDAFTQSLVIAGGMGGDGLSASRDGLTAMWMTRISNDLSSWVVTVRTSAISDLIGQLANDFGRALLRECRDFNRGFSMAPDASVFVVSLKPGDGYDLSLRDIFTGEKIQRLTTTGASDGALNMHPDVSPHGLLVAFSAQDNVEANGDLYVIRIDGTGKAKVTSSPDSNDLRPSWSPNGNQLACQSRNDASNNPNWDIYIMDVFGDGSSTGQGPQTLPPGTNALPTPVPVTICDTTPSGESRGQANAATATGAYAGCRISGDGTTATLNLTLIEFPPTPCALQRGAG